jgi:hypothetical protein
MRQLPLAELEQTFADWLRGAEEALGIDPRNDPDREGSVQRLVDAVPASYRDPAAAMYQWLANKIKDDWKTRGIRPLLQIVPHQENQETRAVSVAWQQLALPGYREWEAENVRRMQQDKAAIERRVTENCALHPDWKARPRQVLRDIYRLANQHT